MKQEKILIQSIKSTVRKGTGRNGIPAVAGDYVINEQPNQPITWISRGELNNLFLRQDREMPPVHMLKGAVLSVDTHDITQAMIDAAIAKGDHAVDNQGVVRYGYLIPINGRMVAFAKPQIKRVVTDINMAGCDFSEPKLNALRAETVVMEWATAKTKNQREKTLTTQATTTSTTTRTQQPASNDEFDDEPTENTTNTKPEPKELGGGTPAADDLHDDLINEAGATGEQQEVKKDEPVGTES